MISDDTNRKLDCCMKQVAEGLEYMHAKNIIHRDIKPANILHDQSSNWKIGDLGLARYLNNYMSPEVGTPYYFPPDQRQTDYDSSVDVYAFGLVLFEICYPIKDETSHVNCFRDLKSSPPQLPNPETRLQRYSDQYDDLITGMIQRLPGNRTSIKEVVERLTNDTI